MGFLSNLMTPAPVPTVNHASQLERVIDAFVAAYSAGSTYAPLSVAGVMRAREMNASIPASLPVKAAGVELVDTYDLVASIIYELQDHGEAYLFHGDGRFRVLQHDDVTVTWDTAKAYRVYTDQMGRRFRTSGPTANLEVISVNRTPDMLQGIGWMQSGIIENLMAQTNWAADYFKNQAAPTDLIEVPGPLDATEAQLLLDQWLETADERTPKVLSGGMKYNSNSFNAVDSEYTTGHLVGIGDIAALSGVPSYFLAYAPSSSSITYTTTSEIWRMYWASTLSIYVHRIEVAWSRILGIDVVFDPEQLLIASLQERTQSASVLVSAGYDPAAVADICGLPPMAVQSQSTLREQSESVGVLIRAGFDPDDAAAVAGLPPMRHLGLPPVTLQAEEEAEVPSDVA